MRAVRRDYAPSRLRYRLQRAWMRPAVRRAVRTGLPLAVLAGSVGWIMADDGRTAVVTGQVAEWRRAVEEHPSFEVGRLVVAGAGAEVDARGAEALGLTLPVSALRLDLPALRERVLAVPQVEDARLRVADGVLTVTLTRRMPAALHRGAAGLSAIDARGGTLAAVEARADRPDLPVLAGPGARDAVPEALEIVRAAGPLADRLAGLSRRGQRRWDAVLLSGQRVLLPAEAPADAMRQAVAIDAAAGGLFDRAVRHLDLRDPARPTIRRLPGTPDA